MRAVSNTSPLSNLAIIGRLELLKRRYGTVVIPPVVASELAALTHPEARAILKIALQDSWIVVQSPPTVPIMVPFPLDPGETEAIRLALALKADVLLIDEKRGREVARQNGLRVAGVLGELLYAKKQGWIPELFQEMQHLRSQARFFIDAEIERFILSEAGEEGSH